MEPAPSELPPAPAVESLEAILSRARAHVAAKRFSEALDDIKRATARGAHGAEWSLVEADALRGSGRAADAANAFDGAAQALAGAARVDAAFSAAYLRFHELRDARGALASLDVATLDGSPLEERGLGLRAQILASLGRRSEARAIAKRYLEKFPRGGLRTYMLGVTRP
jgi:tetratricopeptide (TPR) repeat protein